MLVGCFLLAAVFVVGSAFGWFAEIREMKGIPTNLVFILRVKHVCLYLKLCLSANMCADGLRAYIYVGIEWRSNNLCLR